MSTGLVVCSACGREVHQWGDRDIERGWVHCDRQDGKRQWSLRSDEHGIDVSEVAKHAGGGGHKHAAGFEQVYLMERP